MAEFFDAYILEVGLPGQRAGKAAGDFGWQHFTSEKFAQSGLRDVSRLLKLDHVGWFKYVTADRLQTREKAEANWWDAIADTAKYPGRDFLGSGECPETFNCVSAACAGGKMRIHLVGAVEFTDAEK